MNLEDTMLNEKDKHCMILLTLCTLYNQKSETKTKWWLPEAEGSGGVVV